MAKRLLAEIPITIAAPTEPPLTVLRFPGPPKQFTVTEMSYRPTSGFMELKVKFPNKNISIAKQRLLNASHMTLKSVSTKALNYYYPVIADGTVTLRPVSSIGVLTPSHDYYSVPTQEPLVKKAESREELEHRRRNINFRLRNMAMETPRILRFMKLQSSSQTLESLIPQGTEHATSVTESISPTADTTPLPPEHNTLPSEHILRPLIPIKLIVLEEIIKNARIVNMKYLVRMAGDEQAVKNALYKMTDHVAGRFVLKNVYYERNLHELRDRLLDLFRASGEARTIDVRFLGEERWLVEEIADLTGKRYVLKGVHEQCDFDAKTIENSNRAAIEESFSDHRMLGMGEICEISKMDSDVVLGAMRSGGYIHLANGAYVLDDASYWFVPVLRVFSDKRSMELNEMLSALEAVGIEQEESVVIGEAKLYCNQRGKKFFLKVVR